ncbi:MAG: TonB-dependent receptor [Spirosomaceae bacterium]|nr:TonB-dependent receptor [Spirosomataceae bacterium]
MKKYYLLTLLIISLISQETYAQQKRYTLSGTVTALEDNAPIPKANIFFIGMNGGILTDSLGKFFITLPEGYYTMIVKSLGFQSQNITIDLNKDIYKEVQLSQAVKDLDEVIIKANKADKNIRETQMGVVRLEMKNLKKIPVVFGEADIIKALTLQPGISTIGEGAGGFNVRGGRVDQNLVLLDGMPIYNTSHLLGFVSAMNSDAIAGVSLYKSGVPAQFGGRLSSLLDMTTKTGNFEKLKGSVSAGILTSKVLLEGPILNNKISFLAAARIAYPNFAISKFPAPTNQSRAFFDDFNLKLNYRINAKNILSLSSYASFDNFQFTADTLYFAKTRTAALKYDRVINDKLSFNLQAVAVNYAFGVSSSLEAYDFTLTSGVKHHELRASVLYSATEKLKFDIGVNAIRYQINGGNLVPESSTSNIINLKIPDEFALETAPYLSLDYAISNKISLQAGVRYSQFSHVGPKTVYSYFPNQSRSTESLADSTVFSKGEVVKKYGGFEPRLSLRFELRNALAIKLNYNKMRQYVHLISNTTAISPVDFWKVSDSYIPPQLADQLSLGLFKNLNENTYEVSVEGYYKKIDNLVEYKNGARLYFNPTIETELLAAKGKAYGVEFSLQKNKGRLKGSVAYTYSRTFAQVASEFPSEQINAGEWFPSTFDKPHNLSVSGQFFIGGGWTFSSNYIFSSGRPITYPDRTYKLIGTTVIDYSSRNLDRIPAYNRLDFSLLKDTRKNLEQEKYWTYGFSLYNFYSRRNPYSIFFASTAYTIQAYQLSVFATAIPGINVTYNF